MGMEREFDDKALPRDRDPVVPRGQIVAGEDRGHYGPDPLSPRARELELELVGVLEVNPPTGCPRRIYRNAPLTGKWEEVTPLLPVQERIRALEEERDTLQLSLQEGKKVIAELESRLRDAVSALSPDGEWVKEGEV